MKRTPHTRRKSFFTRRCQLGCTCCPSGVCIDVLYTLVGLKPILASDKGVFETRDRTYAFMFRTPKDNTPPSVLKRMHACALMKYPLLIKHRSCLRRAFQLGTCCITVLTYCSIYHAAERRPAKTAVSFELRIVFGNLFLNMPPAQYWKPLPPFNPCGPHMFPPLPATPSAFICVFFAPNSSFWCLALHSAWRW